jgi:hypothetical protein
MANSKACGLKKGFSGGRGYAKASSERIRVESTHALLEVLVGDRLVHEKRVVMQAAGKYCDLLRPATYVEGHTDWALIGEASLARSSK